MEPKFKTALVCLITAALCGLIGLLVVYYYATLERPMKHFAIVVDAGSTQTRSGLFTIVVDNQALAKWTDNEQDESIHHIVDESADYGHDSATIIEQDNQHNSKHRRRPLSKILQVRQVSGCVNGGPLANLKSPEEAREMVRKCLAKFVNHIKKLDFVEVTSAEVSEPPTGADDDDDDDESISYDDLEGLDSEEVSKQLAMMNHRVNSVTHLYLGATAGMRSLLKINPQMARQRLSWIDRALNESGSLIQSDTSPYINKGFVGIIRGSDEAAFGWVSVNFVCDNLVPLPHQQHRPSAADSRPATQTLETTPVATQSAQDAHLQHYDEILESIGSLELGGASAQMAFQVPKEISSKQLKRIGFFERNMELFNANYRLATRSDLCLGMSQAVLRANYVLLRDLFQHQASTMIQQLSGEQPSVLEVDNACLQNGSRLQFSGKQLQQIWSGSCLLASGRDSSASAFLNKLTTNNTLTSVIVRGTGNVDQCDRLLDKLIEPAKCQEYFSLCPANKNKQSPLNGMPFVTMSGYNHALNVLDLKLTKPSFDVHVDHDGQQPFAFTKSRQHQLQVLADKLGGSSVNFTEFLLKTQDFCSTSISELSSKYSKVSKPYENIICLQLVYIRKLLTEFYLFDPNLNWPQIKFLLSNPSQDALPTVAGKKLDVRRDIGWTLGLLLNATSTRLSQETQDDHNGTIFFHHGSTLFYVIRTTIFILFACCLLAVCALVVAIFGVGRAQRGGAYLNHS